MDVTVLECANQENRPDRRHGMDSMQKTFVTSPIRRPLGAVGDDQGPCSNGWNLSRTSADCRCDALTRSGSITNTRELKKHTECFNCSRTYFDRFFEACPHCGSDSVLHYSSEEMNYFCREARVSPSIFFDLPTTSTDVFPDERIQRFEPRGTPSTRAATQKFTISDSTARHAVCGRRQPFSRVRSKRIRM